MAMNKKTPLVPLIALLLLVMSVGYAGSQEVSQVELNPVLDTEKMPYNAVGMLVGKRTFASAFVVENQRLVLTTAPLSQNQTLGEYRWHSEWNAGPSAEEDNATKLLRRVWIFTGQRGYAAHWHKRTTKMRPGFALLESYEDLVPKGHSATRSTTPYALMESEETKKQFVGYPQKISKYPTSQSATPLSRPMHAMDLGKSPLEPLKLYRDQPFMTLETTSDLNNPDRFSGCEGAPLFAQNKEGNWEVTGIYSKEIYSVQAGNSTLLFRVLDQETYDALIKPALPQPLSKKPLF